MTLYKQTKAVIELVEEIMGHDDQVHAILADAYEALDNAAAELWGYDPRPASNAPDGMTLAKMQREDWAAS